MILQTNINKTEKIHNLLEFEPLEKQFISFLKDLLGPEFDLQYKISGSERYVIINNNFNLTIVIKNKFIVSFNPYYYTYTYNYRLANDLNANFSFNKDISKRMNDYTSKIKQIISLYERSHDLKDWYEKNKASYADSIVSFLNSKFSSPENKLTTSLFLYDSSLFGNKLLTFYIYPRDVKDKKWYSPSDGEIVQINQDGSCSIYEREPDSSYKTATIDDFFKRVVYPSGIEGSKEKIKDMEDLENRIQNFSAKECPELVILLEKCKEGNVLFLEGEKIKS